MYVQKKSLTKTLIVRQCNPTPPEESVHSLSIGTKWRSCRKTVHLWQPLAKNNIKYKICIYIYKKKSKVVSFGVFYNSSSDGSSM